MNIRAIKLEEQGREPELPRGFSCAGFTLLELLVVITIIGILAAIGLPAIRGMTKSNAMAAADRQLVDDIAFARSSAIANHTTVYMVFVPPDITNASTRLTHTNYIDNQITNLYIGQYTTYSFIALRSVGDQPGISNPHYLTAWRSLPNGIYIATNKFTSFLSSYAPPFTNAIVNSTNVQFPLAPGTTNSYHFPYIAFNYLGQLVAGSPSTPTFRPEYIQLAHGSILYSLDLNNNPFADVLETPAGNAYFTQYTNVNATIGTNLPSPEDTVTYNQIYVDPLTGKARVQRLDVQ